MRRTCTRAALVALACAAPLAAGGPASAAPAGTTAQSWYWAEQSGVGPAPVGAPSQASGVPDGDLGVSYTSDVDKVAALGLGTAGAPAGAHFTRYALSLVLDPSAEQLANGTPRLSACRALSPVADGAAPGPLADAPPIDTVVCADGRFDAAGSRYVFDLAALATDWAGGTPANGVVVRPKAGDSTPFSYAFKGGAAVTVDAAYTAPAAAAGAPAAAPSAAAAAPAPPAGGAGVPLPAAQVPEAAPAPALPAGDTPQVAPAPALPGPVAAAPGTPQVAPAAPVPAAAPLASGRLSDLSPSTGVVAGGLGLAALLLAVSLVLGDPLAPLPLDGRRRRFAEVVRAQTRSGRPGAASGLRTA